MYRDTHETSPWTVTEERESKTWQMDDLGQPTIHDIPDTRCFLLVAPRPLLSAQSQLGLGVVHSEASHRDINTWQLDCGYLISEYTILALFRYLLRRAIQPWAWLGGQADPWFSHSSVVSTLCRMKSHNGVMWRVRLLLVWDDEWFVSHLLS